MSGMGVVAAYALGVVRPCYGVAVAFRSIVPQTRRVLLTRFNDTLPIAPT